MSTDKKSIMSKGQQVFDRPYWMLTFQRRELNLSLQAHLAQVIYFLCVSLLLYNGNNTALARC